jgi:PPOX class probable FMN-dependent enzyme
MRATCCAPATGDAIAHRVIAMKDSKLSSESDLRSVYRNPAKAVQNKAIDYIDDFARRFIALSPFVCVGSSKARSADVSPRGGDPGFVHVIDAHHLAMPDYPGNNRLDTFTNLLNESAIGLLFLIPGINEVLRINGQAELTVASDLVARFTQDDRRVRSVVLVRVQEVFLHCSKALRRSDLWNSERHVARAALPSWGQMLRDQRRTVIPYAVIDFLLEQEAKRNLY